jgi:hypothetical protein
VAAVVASGFLKMDAIVAWLNFVSCFCSVSLSLRDDDAIFLLTVRSGYLMEIYFLFIYLKKYVSV